MGPVNAEIEIDVPRERAYDFLADLSNRPSFTDHFITGFHLSRIESTGIGAGARFELEPISTWMDTVIEELEPPHRISERGRGGRVNRTSFRTAWELSEAASGMTSVRVVFWSEPVHVFDRVREVFGARSMRIRRQWEEALRRLRELLESDQILVAPRQVAGGNRSTTGIP